MEENKLTPVEEDVEIGLDNQTIDIKLKLKMKRDVPDASFNYKTDIDEVGQIVLTPDDTTTSFVEISATTSDEEINIEDGNEKTFTLNLTADLLFEDDSLNDDPTWEANIDEVGQAVIYPITEKASFLTVSVKDSLNLITEEKENDSDSSNNEDTDKENSPDRKPESSEVKEENSEKQTEEQIEDIANNVTAEVKESLNKAFPFSTVLNTLIESTNKFSRTSGQFKTTYITEALFTQKILEKYYTNVTREVKEDWSFIHYQGHKEIPLTEDIDPNSEEFIEKREMAEELIDNLESSLHDAIEYLNGIESLFEEIGIHSADIPGYFTNYIDNFIDSDREISCTEFRNRLEEYANGEN